MIEVKNITAKPYKKFVWLGSMPLTKVGKKGLLELKLHSNSSSIKIKLEKEKATWLIQTLNKLSVYNNTVMTYAEIKNDFEKQFEDFELFWFSNSIEQIRKFGIIEI